MRIVQPAHYILQIQFQVFLQLSIYQHKISLTFHQKNMRLMRISMKHFSNLRNIYETTIKSKNMQIDPKQIQVIELLSNLNEQLINKHAAWKKFSHYLVQQPAPSYQNMSSQQQKQQRKSNFFNIFSKNFSTSINLDCRVPGLYLYGSSGSGKSFVSDLFYENLQIAEKRKVHFHEFMAEIHNELFKLEREKKGFDPLFTVARKTAKKTRLLYLDEFQVTDVADASILKRLFQRLFDSELVLLATSNRHPKDLYKSGHQRQFFLPFIQFLEDRCRVKFLDSSKDYRYSMQKDTNPMDESYLTPIDQVSEQRLKIIIQSLTGVTEDRFARIQLEPIAGRKLVVPKCHGKTCIYQFNQLFDNIMGDADFRAICKNFQAIVIKNMRTIKRNERNVANRLIKLFDEAYFRNVKIYINAEVGLDEIIQPLDQKQATTEQDFAMIRCKSRLMEFQSKQYKQKVSYAQNPTAWVQSKS